MSELEVKAVVDHKDAPLGWPVVIQYEVDRNQIKPVSMYEDHAEADTDYLPTLSREQYQQVLGICQDDYNELCDIAQSMAEDAADTMAQIAREEQRNHLATADRQRPIYRN